MKVLLKSVSVMLVCLSVFYASYLLTSKYLNRFRKNYITVENEYINV